MAVVLLWCLVALLVLGLLSTWLLVYQILRQQGRLLLRLESLEVQVGSGDNELAESQGLAVGAVVSAFRLPDLAGLPCVAGQVADNDPPLEIGNSRPSGGGRGVGLLFPPHRSGDPGRDASCRRRWRSGQSKHPGASRGR
jgi:hypothetical protein